MNTRVNTLASSIFLSRWLQAPLYFGLIIVLGIYIVKFSISLYELVMSFTSITETEMMLHALNLIDVVMIANLLIMVIIGGYEIFVSRLRLHNHPDHPEWLDEVNAGSMKIKLAIALITISSIHLLRTFMDPSKYEFYTIMWQVVIHITLVVSAIAIAFSNNLMEGKNGKVHAEHANK